MSKPLQVRTAQRDTGMKCCDCRAQIKAGEEFAVEAWPNQSGFDYFHVECPALDDHADRIAKPIRTQAPR